MWQNTDIEIQYGPFTTVTLRFTAPSDETAAGSIARSARLDCEHLREKLQAASLPALAEYRARDRQNAPIVDGLRVADLQLRKNAADDGLARVELSGMALAQRLAGLAKERQELEATVTTLNEGKALFAADVNRSRSAARDELQKLAEEAAAEAIQDMDAEFARHKQRLIASVVEHLTELRELDTAVNCRPISTVNYRVPLKPEVSAVLAQVLEGTGEWANLSTDAEPARCVAPPCVAAPCAPGQPEAALPAPTEREPASRPAKRKAPQRVSAAASPAASAAASAASDPNAQQPGDEC
jgi:hypothetical protein